MDEDKQSLKDAFEVLAQKYKLPSFDELNHEFEIEDIDNDSFILRNLRRNIVERLVAFSKILEDILQPDTTLVHMYEYKSFTEEEKREYFYIFRDIVIFERKSMKLEINLSEESDAKYINDVFSYWKKIKQSFIVLFDKIIENWEKDEEQSHDLGYLG